MAEAVGQSQVRRSGGQIRTALGRRRTGGIEHVDKWCWIGRSIRFGECVEDCDNRRRSWLCRPATGAWSRSAARTHARVLLRHVGCQRSLRRSRVAMHGQPCHPLRASYGAGAVGAVWSSVCRQSDDLPPVARAVPTRRTYRQPICRVARWLTRVRRYAIARVTRHRRRHRRSFERCRDRPMRGAVHGAAVLSFA